MSQGNRETDNENVESEVAITEALLGSVMECGSSKDKVKLHDGTGKVRGIAGSMTYEWIATQGFRGDLVAQVNKMIALIKSGTALVLLYTDGATPFRANIIYKGDRLQATASTAGRVDLAAYSTPPTLAEIDKTVGSAAETVLDTTDQDKIKVDLHIHSF